MFEKCFHKSAAFAKALGIDNMHSTKPYIGDLVSWLVCEKPKLCFIPCLLVHLWMWHRSALEVTITGLTFFIRIIFYNNFCEFINRKQRTEYQPADRTSQDAFVGGSAYVWDVIVINGQTYISQMEMTLMVSAIDVWDPAIIKCGDFPKILSKHSARL